MIKKQPVPDSSRFNWKDGFYSLEKMEIYKAMNEKQEEEKQARRYGKGERSGRPSRQIQNQKDSKKRRK